MRLPTLQISEVKKTGDYLHNPDYSLEKGLSWLHLEDDATTIHTSSDSDEPNDDEEVQRGVRVHHNSDRLPPAWCYEAERETPEPEKTLNVGANPSTQAQSAPHQGQQDSCHAPASLSDIICGLEFGRDTVTGEVVYRRKVLEYQEVDQETLCTMIDEKSVHAVFYHGKPASDELVALVYNSSVLCLADFEVVVAAAEWSDWKSWESYEADEASYNYYQMVLRTGGSFR